MNVIKKEKLTGSAICRRDAVTIEADEMELLKLKDALQIVKSFQDAAAKAIDHDQAAYCGSVGGIGGYTMFKFRIGHNVVVVEVDHGAIG